MDNMISPGAGNPGGKVLILTGSPRRQGTTAALAAAFAEGAARAGHEVIRFDTAFMDIAPCLGCDRCRRTGGCVRQDDMAQIWPALLEADAVALVTPLYYFGICAQLKTAIDRFYAVNPRLRGMAKRAALLSACADGEEEAMEALAANYRIICNYLGWKSAGEALAIGCRGAGDLEGKPFLDQARALGAGLFAPKS